MGSPQKLEVVDFSGGMTDSYIGVDPRKNQTLDNLTIRQDRKLQSRMGSYVLSADYPKIATDARIDSIFRHQQNNIYQSANKIYHLKDAGWTEVTGTVDGTSAFSTSVAEQDQNSYCTYGDHIIATNDDRVRPLFMYKDGTDYKMYSMGIRPSSYVGVTHSSSGASSRYYRFVRKWNYTINGVDFEVRSEVADDCPQMTGALPNTLSNIPTLSNAGNDHYDTTNIVTEIYRTADAGSAYYKVGEISNATTTYDDSTADVDLTDGLQLYTDGEDLDYMQPPACKYVVELAGVIYYLNVTNSDGIQPNMGIQAPAGMPHAANEALSFIVEGGEITGGGTANSFVIVFTKDRAYRLEGTFDAAGRGGIKPVEISRIDGCVSHKSVVSTAEGCFFASQNGFCFTDGYKVIRISKDIPTTYSLLVQSDAQSKRIYGTYDAINKIIFWAVTSDSDVTDNDQLFCAHLEWGIREDTPFTTWSSGEWADNFQPTSVVAYDGRLLRGDTRGYILLHSSAYLDDKLIDTSEADPSLWHDVPVVYDIKTASHDFGDVTRRKWVTRLILYADALSKLSIRASSNNDNSGSFNELAELRSNTPIAWGDPEVEWGDANIRWNFSPIVSGNRYFPKSGLRCSYKQLRLKSSYTLIESTDITSKAVNVDATAKTATRGSGVGDFDSSLVEYYIYFETDSYLTGYRITGVSGDVITFSDSSNHVTSASLAGYKIYGYRKSETLRLLSYSIVYQEATPTQGPAETQLT